MDLFAKLDNKKYLIFDFDRTIVKLLIDWTDWHDGLREVMKSFDPGFNIEGKISNEIQNDFVKKYGEPFRQKLLGFNGQFEKDNCKGYEVYDELVKYIKATGKTCYLFTANNHSNVSPVLKELELEGRFEKIVSRDDVKFIKPDPFGINLILDGREDKEDFVMVGDHDEKDGGSARAAGIDFILVDYFYEN